MIGGPGQGPVIRPDRKWWRGQAHALSQRVAEIHAQERAHHHLPELQTNTELVYRYLTGQRFCQRIHGIVAVFETLQRDLDAERKAITRQWTKREAQIERVMQTTIGLSGDLQGIAGAGLKEIEGLELPALAYRSTRAVAADASPPDD